MRLSVASDAQDKVIEADASVDLLTADAIASLVEMLVAVKN